MARKPATEPTLTLVSVRGDSSPAGWFGVMQAGWDPEPGGLDRISHAPVRNGRPSTAVRNRIDSPLGVGAAAGTW